MYNLWYVVKLSHMFSKEPAIVVVKLQQQIYFKQEEILLLEELLLTDCINIYLAMSCYSANMHTANN